MREPPPDVLGLTLSGLRALEREFGGLDWPGASLRELWLQVGGGVQVLSAVRNRGGNRSGLP